MSVMLQFVVCYLISFHDALSAAWIISIGWDLWLGMMN